MSKKLTYVLIVHRINNYARDILKNLFPLGEESISKDSHYSYMYARLLEEPFPLGEEIISKESFYNKKYKRFLRILEKLLK